MLLEIKDVSMRFGGILAVNQCSFGVEQGGITCLIGPNGAGKTTIFNMITGFLQPTAGTLFYKGNEITNLKPEKIVELGIVRTFQNLRLFNDMTVIENTMLSKQKQMGESIFNAVLRRRAVKREEQENYEESMEVLRYVGLGDKAMELTDNLSYAEQKLLTIARLLMADAEVLLLDEPASGLDNDSLELILPILRDLKKKGKTILLIEHNMDIIKSIADKVIFLNQGHVLGSGTAEEIMSNSELTQIYFGGGAYS